MIAFAPSPVDAVLESLRELGCNPVQCGGQWTARCPAHEDRNPSLSVSTGDDGRALLNCHAMCSYEAICAALGLRPSDLFVRSVMPPKNPPKPRRLHATLDAAFAATGRAKQWGAPTVTWQYVTGVADPWIAVARYDPPEGKQFTQATLREGEGWFVGLEQGEQRPLYNLPVIIDSDDVWIVEGEKCADLLCELGLCGTTALGGAKAAKRANLRPLSGRDRVILIPDQNQAGEHYVRDLVQMLHALPEPPKEIKVVRLPGLGDGEDVEQFIQLHGREGAKAELVAMAGAAPREERPAAAVVAAEPQATPRAGSHRGRPPIELVRLSDIEEEETEWVWPGYFPAGEPVIIGGGAGAGKGHATTSIAAILSTAGRFPTGEQAPLGDVILMTPEDSMSKTVAKRVRQCGGDKNRIWCLTGFPHIKDDIDRIIATVEQVERCVAVIIDPVFSYCDAEDQVYKNAAARALLGPLHDAAARYGFVPIEVFHPSKAQHEDPLHQLNGSGAFIEMARAVYIVARDPETDLRRFFPVKNNLARLPQTLEFEIDNGVTWLGPVDEDYEAFRRRVRAGSSEELTQLQSETIRWLTEYLGEGPRLAQQLQDDASACGLRKALSVARRHLRIIVAKDNAPGKGVPSRWYTADQFRTELARREAAGQPPLVATYGREYL